MVIHRSYGHSLYNNYYAEYVSPHPPQISREGTDQKHMSFFSWPYGLFIFNVKGGKVCGSDS